MISPCILGGVFLGWSLGANDAANVFGGAVSSQMVRYRTATILIALFVILGALINGMPGMRTIAGLSPQSSLSAFIISVAAALTVTVLTLLNLPISTSQALVGSILGVGLIQGELNLLGLKKVVTCWAATPVSAGVIAIILYPVLGKLISQMKLHFLAYDRLMRLLLILSGSYSAYALGANNVANVTGVFYQAKMLTAFQSVLIGGLSIALGAATYGKGVMFTVGKKLLPLNAFSAFIVLLSGALTVHTLALIGVPVSTSQAVVGAVLGIGLIKGIRTVSGAVLLKIVGGWLGTPLMGGLFSYAIYYLMQR